MNTNEPSQNNKFKSLLEKMHSNELSVHSKTYFRLKLVALILVAVLVAVISILIFSFILFILRVSGQGSLFGFGVNGFTVFLLLFPWKLLAVDVLLIFILEWLLRSFRFGYRVPVLYLLAGILLVMAVGGFILDRETPLHDNLSRQAHGHHLPRAFGELYEGVRRSAPPPFGHGIFRGSVTAIGTSTFQVSIDDPRTATTTMFTVVAPTAAFLGSLTVGERVFISGEIINGAIQARDVREGPAQHND